MADEVQTGVGRTGAYLASDALGFEPEVVTLAKGIAGGIPMGACLFRGKAAGVFAAGDHQSTFAGNPLACRAAITVLETLQKPGFYERVQAAGQKIKEEGQENDLVDRIAADPVFHLSREDVESVLEPERYTGRAPE